MAKSKKSIVTGNENSECGLKYLPEYDFSFIPLSDIDTSDNFHFGNCLNSYRSRVINPLDLHGKVGSWSWFNLKFLFLGAVMGLEINGDDSVKICYDILDTMLDGKDRSELVFTSASKDTSAKNIDDFYNFVDITMS